MAGSNQKRLLFRFVPFWFFLLLFKFGGAFHFTILSPLGEKILPLSLVGIIISFSSLLQVFLDIPAGFLLDRFGYRKLLAVGTIPFICAGFLLTLPLTPAIFTASVLLGGLGWLFFGPGFYAYGLSHASRKTAGTFLGISDMASSIGTVGATILFSFALGLPIRIVGFIIAGFLIMALAALLMSPRDRASAHAEVKIESQHWYVRRSYFRELLSAIERLNPASTIFLVSVLSSGIFYSTVWFVIPLVVAKALTSSLLGVALSGFNFAIILLGFLLGRLADRGRQKLLIALGLTIFAVAGMIIGFHLNWLFLLFGFIASLGDEMSTIALWKWLHALDRNHARDGAVASLITLSNDIGWSIGPLIAGFLYPVLGPSWTIFIGSLFLLTTLILFSFSSKRDRDFLPRIPKRPRFRKAR